MRYIEKNYQTEAVQQYNEELVMLQLNKNSLIDSDTHPGRSGAQLYEMVRNMQTFSALKKQMYFEQGGVCCYCGMKLEYPFDPQYRVEHVKPKESHRELVGEYQNLLLSCKPTNEEKKIRKDSKSKAERKKYMHCDEAKGSKEITYSPLDHDCEKVFRYDISGKIHYNESYPDAKNDIEVLRLSGDYLTNRRKAAIDSLYDDDGGLLSIEELIDFRNSLQERKSDGKYAEFYFVIIDAIDQLLPTV